MSYKIKRKKNGFAQADASYCELDDRAYIEYNSTYRELDKKERKEIYNKVQKGV